MRRFATLATITSATLVALLSGCGGNPSSSYAGPAYTPPASNPNNPSNPSNPSSPTNQPVAEDDVAQSSAASVAVGSAADAGVTQLFSGGTAAKIILDPHPALAWQAPKDRLMNDGPSPLDVLVKSVDTSPAPTLSSGTLNPSYLPANAGASASGIPYAIDSTGLPAGFFHIQLMFDATHVLTIHDDNGDTAVINAGELDIYVEGTLVSAGTVAQGTFGNWDYVVTHYCTMPAANPITVHVTTNAGNTWTTTVTGLRHCTREYVRTRVGTGDAAQITLAETTTVDGDFSGYPTGAAVASPGNGPSMADANGGMHDFTKWSFASVNAAGATHSFVWDRYATFGLTYSHTGVAVGTVSISVTPFDNIYITKDGGTAVGPLTPDGLNSRFHVVGTVTGAAADY